VTLQRCFIDVESGRQRELVAAMRAAHGAAACDAVLRQVWGSKARASLPQVRLWPPLECTACVCVRVQARPGWHVQGWL
jgi:hypothetical protein